LEGPAEASAGGEPCRPVVETGRGDWKKYLRVPHADGRMAEGEAGRLAGHTLGQEPCEQREDEISPSYLPFLLLQQELCQMKVHKFVLKKRVEKERYIEIETEDNYDHQALNALLWNQVNLLDSESEEVRNWKSGVVMDFIDTTLPRWDLDEDSYEVETKKED